MSRIFLPNGGQIELPENWISTTNTNGSVTYRKNDDEKTYLGTITASGIVHFSNYSGYKYYPPPIHSLDAAYHVLTDNIKNLHPWQLKELKKQLEEFNAKTYSWK
jgi:hypothetical protein